MHGGVMSLGAVTAVRFRWPNREKAMVAARDMSEDGECICTPVLELLLCVAVLTIVAGCRKPNQQSDRLTKLTLSGVNVTDGELKSAVRKHPRLRTLTLEFTKVTDAGLASLPHLSQLEELDVGGVGHEITDVGMAHVTQLHNLRGINLDDTIITNAGLKRLTSLTSLEGLHIGNTRVTDEGLVHLQAFRDLRVLNLEQTKITDDGLVHLQGLAKLEVLYLNMTAVSDAGLPQLNTISSLRHLELYDTLATDANVEKLQRGLPQCKIITRIDLNDLQPLIRPLR